MAIRKDPSDRVRRNKQSIEARLTEQETLPEWDGLLRGPELPKRKPGGSGGWHALTVIWWETFRKSPQAMYAADTDWEALLIGALIHDRIMGGVSDTAMGVLSAQLQKRESSFGATIEDRRRIGLGDAGKRPAPVEKPVLPLPEIPMGPDYYDRLQKSLGNQTKTENLFKT